MGFLVVELQCQSVLRLANGDGKREEYFPKKKNDVKNFRTIFGGGRSE